MTARHTVAQLLAEIRADRRDRDEPEDGAEASEREIRRWMKRAAHVR